MGRTKFWMSVDRDKMDRHFFSHCAFMKLPTKP